MNTENTSTISFEHIKQFNKLILDYAHQKTEVKPFYNLPPTIDSFGEMIKQKNFDHSFRPTLVQELFQQYETAGITLKKKETTTQQLELLKEPTTFTVTTGHQLCLFTGPLYFVHKILSVVKWCEELKLKYPEHNFVPVFWMASEDHDFAEVNHLITSQGKISWDMNSNEQPVGRLPLNGFENFAKQVSQLAQNNFAQNQIEELIQFYTTSQNLSQATRKLVHKLFAPLGVIIMDADSITLKQQLIPYIKKDITENSNYQALNTCNIELKKQGYKTQINGREINFFYLSEMGRKLINKNKKNYTVDGTTITWTEEEILNEIETHPEKFSPNVVLRPLYQEIILPNLAYIGGPGEIAYWLQLKPVFDNNHTAFPILTLRSFVLLVSHQHNNQLRRMGLSVDDLFNDTTEIERKLVTLIPDGGQNNASKALENLFQELIDIANKTDNKISSELINLKVLTRSNLDKILKVLDQKQRLKVEQNAFRATEIKRIYFPNNSIQERYYNLFEWGNKQSINDLVNTIHHSINLTQTDIQVIYIH